MPFPSSSSRPSPRLGARAAAFLTGLPLAATLTLLVALVVSWATLSPAEQLPAAPGGDKLHHFLAFAALAAPLSFARPRRALWVVLAAAAFGGAIELVQPHVGRHGDLADALANTLGAMAGAAVAVVTRWAAGRLGLVPPAPFGGARF